MVRDRSQILARSGAQVVNNDHFVPGLEQVLGEMGPNKPATPGD
jgi:hypothetical protein